MGFIFIPAPLDPIEEGVQLINSMLDFSEDSEGVLGHSEVVDFECLPELDLCAQGLDRPGWEVGGDQRPNRLSQVCGPGEFGRL